MSRVLVGGLAIVASSLGSCTYLSDRALDALDPYRAAVGVGTVVGVRSQGLGLYDTGIMFGLKANGATFGWRYGGVRFPTLRDPTFDADQAEIIKTTSLLVFDYADGSYRSARNSFALLPAVFSWVDRTPNGYEWEVPQDGEDYVDRTWIWSADAFRTSRYEQVHAFDIEGDIALFGFLDLGFSPGEVADFFLGILTIDIAQDDGRL